MRDLYFFNAEVVLLCVDLNNETLPHLDAIKECRDEIRKVNDRDPQLIIVRTRCDIPTTNAAGIAEVILWCRTVRLVNASIGLCCLTGLSEPLRIRDHICQDGSQR